MFRKRTSHHDVLARRSHVVVSVCKKVRIHHCVLAVCISCLVSIPQCSAETWTGNWSLGHLQPDEGFPQTFEFGVGKTMHSPQGLPPFDAQLTIPVNDYGMYDITVTEPTASMYGLDWNAFEAAITSYSRWYFGFKFASVEINETGIASPLTFDLTDIRVQFRYDFSQRGRLDRVTTTIRGDATYLEPVFPEPATFGQSMIGVILWLISSRRRGRVACR